MPATVQGQLGLLRNQMGTIQAGKIQIYQSSVVQGGVAHRRTVRLCRGGEGRGAARGAELTKGGGASAEREGKAQQGGQHAAAAP